MSTAAKTAEVEAKAADEGTEPDYGSVTFDGVDYPISRKPNAILISELSRTGTGDPESLGVLAEFFEATLGADTYRAFKRHTYRFDGDDAEIIAVIGQVMEKTLGRPTE